jgi:hypothetical protein
MLKQNDVEPDETHILCYVCKSAACVEMRRNAYIGTVGKYEGKRWFGRSKRRREINARYQTKGLRGLEPDISSSG